MAGVMPGWPASLTEGTRDACAPCAVLRRTGVRAVRLSGPGFLLGVPVLGGLFTLVTAVILARVGGRLLGIRLRWRRAILAGFPGLVLGSVAAWSINGQRHGPHKLSWPAVLIGALVTTMLVAVLLDLPARCPPASGSSSRSSARM